MITDAEDSGLLKTAKRFSSHRANAPVEVVGNRVVAAMSTIGIGGSIAEVITYYWQPPEAIHAHAVAIIIAAYQTLVYLVSKYGPVIFRHFYGGEE